MKIGKIFPSKYLKVEDLNGRRVAVTIAKVTIEDMGDGRQKPVLHFTNADKTFALNITNANMLAMLTKSDDTDDWTGYRIILRPDMTTFGGKPTPCIRIDSQLAPAKPGTKPAPPPPDPDPEEEFGEGLELGDTGDEDDPDSIPF